MLGPARAAERVEELPAPRLLGRPRLDRLARVHQHGHLVDAAVGGAGDALHDERHGQPAVRRRLLDERGRGRVRRVIGHELVRGVAIEVVDPRRRVALRVDGRAERRIRRVRIARVRRHLLAGEHRAADRMVGDRDPLAGPARVAHRQRVRSDLQAGDEPFQAPARPQRERAGDVDAVDVDANRRRVDARLRVARRRARRRRRSGPRGSTGPRVPAPRSRRAPCLLRATPPPRRRPPTRGQRSCPPYALLSPPGNR